jgi:hypothetical protein
MFFQIACVLNKLRHLQDTASLWSLPEYYMHQLQGIQWVNNKLASELTATRSELLPASMSEYLVTKAIPGL